MTRIGILRETRDPPDRRVPLSPDQCGKLLSEYRSASVCVCPSPLRCFSDREYSAAGCKLTEDMSGCDILMGVKEVNIDRLIPEKTYLFFSHTAKKQPQNRLLLKETARRGITLVDYEYLTGKKGNRLVTFGRWAGVAGAFNALLGYGKLSGRYELRPAHACYDSRELFGELDKVDLHPVQILITGGGRVASGAMEVLDRAGIMRVNPDDYLHMDFGGPVYAQTDPWHYARRKDGSMFSLRHFFSHPEAYESAFLPYARRTDLYIACHYWDPASPAFFAREDMLEDDFDIKMIADVSCDVNGPIPSTVRASEIADPFYGYDPVTGKETGAFREGAVTVMAVDNLPGGLPRDASVDFGKMLLKEVMPALLDDDPRGIIKGAMILDKGRLTEKFRYLEDYPGERI